MKPVRWWWKQHTTYNITQYIQQQYNKYKGRTKEEEEKMRDDDDIRKLHFYFILT